MNKAMRQFARSYAAELRRYLARPQESSLQRAYELGRKAVANGFGVLDVAKMHQDILWSSILSRCRSAQHAETLQTAESFLLEALSLFEVTHRGFRESNARLQELIRTLERRNIELANINLKLESEVAERVRTELALRDSEHNFRILSNKTLHVQEQERTRISRELHDEVGQALTAINVNLAVLKDQAECLSPRFARKLVDTQRLLETTMETVHHFARELRPAMLDDLGLLPALRSYLKAFAERTGIRVRFKADATAEKLDAERKTVVFRVMQESLTNVAKHARASQVEVTLQLSKRVFHLHICDDGKASKSGLEKLLPMKNRLGLMGMRERLHLVGGGFDIQFSSGKGTTVKVEIPIQPA